MPTRMPWFQGSTRLTLAAASGVLYAAAQPGPDVWPLAFVCLAPLVLASGGASPGGRAALGWVAGTIAATIVALEASAGAIARYFEIATWQGFLGGIALGQLFGALPFALFSILLGDLRNAGPGRCALQAGAALAVAEWLRGNWLTGLPWGLLTYSLADVPCLAQGAALAGAAGISFVLGAGNGALASALRAPRGPRIWLVSALAPALLLASGFAATVRHPGVMRVDGAPREREGIRIALIQGGLAGAARREPARVAESLRHLLVLSAGAQADLVVWPESAVPVVLPANQGLLIELLERSRLGARGLLFGASRIEPDRPGDPYNSAVLMRADGPWLGFHDKIHRVPFAEYVPPWLSWLGLGRNAVRAGADLEPLLFGDVRLGALICYEIMFERLARRLVQRGADVLVNLSNDEWLAGTVGLEQHRAAAVFRAIETGRPVLRATNTGITMAIDAAGRVVDVLPEDQPGVIVVDVRPGRGITPYVRIGNWVPATAAVFLLAGPLARRFRRATREA